MTNQKFKINTATQKAAIHRMDVAAGIMKKCGMSYQEWSDVLFEKGCQFIEKNVKHQQIQESLLQNRLFGFWDWWMILFLEDDESLLSFPEITSLISYIKEKDRLLNLMEPVKQFDYFMIKNERINELEKV